MGEKIEPVVMSRIKQPKKRRLLRILKRILLWGSLSIVLLITLTISFVYFFGGEIKKFALDKLNQQLLTPVSFHEVNFSVLRKFPHASLEFTEVTCKGVGASAKDKPLLEAGSVFLEFNILDVLRGNYKVKKISLKDGVARMIIDEKGNNNFVIWKEQQQKGGEKSLSFDLRSVSITNFLFEFDDRRGDFHIISDIQNLRLAGNFSAQQHTLDAKGDVFVTLLNISGITYLEDKQVAITTSLDINLAKQEYKILKADAVVEAMHLEASGLVKAGANTFIDLDMSGKNMDVRSFLSLFPSTKAIADEYQSKGVFYLNGKIKGYLGKGNFPFMAIGFGVKNGAVTYRQTGITMTDLSFQGEFRSGDIPSIENSVLQLKNVTARIKSSVISGWLNISNLKDPLIHFYTQSNVNLEDVFGFLKLNTIEQMSGNAQVEMEFKGRKKGKEFHYESLKNSELKGSVVLQSGKLKFKNNKQVFHRVNGKFIFDNDVADVIGLSGMAGTTDFAIDGKIHDLLPYLWIKDARLRLNAKFSSENIDLDEWFASGNSTTGDFSATDYHFRIPTDFDIYFEAGVKKIKFRKFTGSNLTGNFALNKGRITVSKTFLQAFEGTIKLDGDLATAANGHYQVNLRSSLSDVNVKAAFAQLENFNQMTLQDKHLKGVIHADVEFSGEFTKTLTIVPGSVVAAADISIQKGELMNFTPMLSLSKFIKVEELQHVYFATLKNRILIRNQQIIIPEMEVNSSALNLVVSGTHGFNNTIDYRFNLLLKEILAEKFKKNHKQEAFGEIIEEEGTGARLFLKMTGTVDNHKISYDIKGVQKKMKEDFKKEENTLKKIFKEEFGAYKKDTTIIIDKPLPKKENKNKVKDSGEFEFEF